MEDKNKSKKQLIDELVQMRQRITELEAIQEERKRAEEVLKDSEEMLQLSEEKYRTLIENLNVGVYRATPGREGRFIDVNQATKTRRKC